MNYRRYRIAICDDERAEAERLGSVVSDWSRAAGIDCAIDTFSGAEALLSAREDRGEYDILLLDVEMRGMDGIALARRLRADGCRAEIIFVTSHFELAGEGYDVDALHYLIKPVDNEKLAEVLKVKITLLTTGEEMYNGLMRDMPKSLSHTLNSNGDAEDELYYEITAYLETDTGNEYQNKQLTADFKWWVEETGNLIPPKTGDSSAVLPWAAAAAVSGCVIIVLIARRRREEEENA